MGTKLIKLGKDKRFFCLIVINGQTFETICKDNRGSKYQ